MSSLSRKAIEEYKAIYKKEFGEDSTDTEAEEQGMNLLRLFQIIYKPIPKSWRIVYSNKQKQDNYTQRGGEKK